MLPIEQLTEDAIFTRYDALPDKLADALDSPANIEAVKKVCFDHHLVDEEKVLMVTQLATFVILGFLHPDDLGSEVNAALELDNPKLSASIATDLKSRIFAPIKNDIEANYYPLATNDSKEEAAPMILAAIGETSAPPAKPKISPLAPSAPPANAALPPAANKIQPPSLKISPSAPPLPVQPAAILPRPISAMPEAVPQSAPKPPSPVTSPIAPLPPPMSPKQPAVSRVESESFDKTQGKSFAAKTEAVQALQQNSGQAKEKLAVSLPVPELKLPIASSFPPPSPSFTPPSPRIAESKPFSPAPPSAPVVSRVEPPFVPNPSAQGAAPLPMMMHEALSAKPIGKGPELRMDFSKQATASSVSAPRPQGVAPKPAQLELGGAEDKKMPQVARTELKTPRVVNYSAAKPDISQGNPFSGSLASPFNKFEPSPMPPAPPQPVPMYKPFGGTPLPPPDKAFSSSPLPPSFDKAQDKPPIPASPAGGPPDAATRHEDFVDLTHLDKK